eukprot:1296586-Prymnesium_polylepis.1
MRTVVPTSGVLKHTQSEFSWPLLVKHSNELNARVQLPAVGVEDDLELLGGGVEREGAERAAVDAHGRGARGDLLRDERHVALGVVGGGVEGELVLADVADLDHGGLVARADERLDRAQLAVLA